MKGLNPYLSGGIVGAAMWWVVGDSGNKATLSNLDFDLGFGKNAITSGKAMRGPIRLHNANLFPMICININKS